MEQKSIEGVSKEGKKLCFIQKLHSQTTVRSKSHRTPLIVAAAKGIVPLLELLIKYHASLDLRSEFVDDFSGDANEKVSGDVIEWGVT